MGLINCEINYVLKQAAEYYCHRCLYH